MNLTATVEWTVENSASWVKVEPMAGDPSKELQPVKVTVSKNEDVERTATVTFKQTDGALTAKLSIISVAYFNLIVEKNLHFLVSLIETIFLFRTQPHTQTSFLPLLV